MHLTDRELATVLAALRFWQRLQYRAESFPEHFSEETPLTREEIDDLCERLNCGARREP